MGIFNTKKIVVTHNGVFHADDIFATAALSLLYNGNIKVIRTRDQEIIQNADVVYDVGGEYDPTRNRFDHHQEGGAGKRENGIPYAAFGLVWKTYGEKICGDIRIANALDKSLVQAIDADDNGMDLFDVKGEVAPYLMQHLFYAFRPSWKETQEYDEPFLEVVEFAKKFLIRKISRTRDSIEAEVFVRNAYDGALDKRLIILDGSYPWDDILREYPEPLCVVYQKADTWRVGCVRTEKTSFTNRKSLPVEWAGKRDEELAQITGVTDAVFCHNGRFMCVSKSKEGAVALAKLALEK